MVNEAEPNTGWSSSTNAAAEGQENRKPATNANMAKEDRNAGERIFDSLGRFLSPY
jgi:hypothetical protein